MNEMRIPKKQNSQSGQALVEVVLLTVIGVALVLGLAAQFYRPFGSWVKNYMGPYLECLLDAGELPTMGDTSGDGICASQFKAGQWDPNGSNLANKNSNPNSSLNSDPGANHKGNNSGDTASVGGGGRYSGRSRQLTRNSGVDGPAQSDEAKQMTEKLPESSYFKLASRTSSYGNYSSRPGSQGNEMIVPWKSERKQSLKEKSVKVNAESDLTSQGKAKKLIVTPPERKVASDDSDIKWSFGQYIKFAMIILIIVAIILFLGGQILQISKSMEK